MNSDAAPSPYLMELRLELNKLDPADYAHAARLIAEETKRVESGDKYKSVATVELHHERPASNAVKIRIPSKEFPKVNFSGKLLGPKGSTLKQLQQQTGCKLSILGKGSMRDKTKEEELRKEGGKYAHLNEELHVLVECFAETTDAYGRLSHALSEIKKFMNTDELNLPNNMGGPQMEERGFYNGEGSMGRGAPAPRGGPAPRGAPMGRGGLLSAPSGRGMSRGGAPAAPGGRGAPAPRGAPGQRGAPSAMRGTMAPRGAPSMRGAPGGQAGRGAMSASRGMPTRPAPIPRGGATLQRGRGMSMPPVSAPSRLQPQPLQVQQEYDDYGAGAAYEEPFPPQKTHFQAYAQETYEDTYARRDPYAEDPYSEPAGAGGDTQFFDYGHGATSAYDEYEDPRAAPRAAAPRAPMARPLGGPVRPATSLYDRSAMKAPPPQASRGARGMYRTQPY